MRLTDGGTVERYRIEGLIGQGGMAEVYRARHTTLGTWHALKVLTITSDGVRRRLLLEGKLQAELRHPNIVSVNDILDLDGVPVLVMEFVDGPSLDELLDLGMLTFAQVDTLARGIIAGVAHAHQRRLVHRDLKPANVMLEVTDWGFTPKVTDFGLAKMLDVEGSSSRTRTGATMGTPFYMSPEQIRDSKKLDHRTDIFALGAMLYEMLTGVRPFERDDILATYTAIAAGDYVPLDEALPDCPRSFVRAVHAALIPDADGRLSSCEELLALWTAGSPPPKDAFGAKEIELARAFQRARRPPGVDTWAPPTSLPETPAPAPRARPVDPRATELVSAVDLGQGRDTVVRDPVARRWWPLALGALAGLTLAVGGAALGWRWMTPSDAPIVSVPPPEAPPAAPPPDAPAVIAAPPAAIVPPIVAPRPKPKEKPVLPAAPPEARTAERPWAGSWSGSLGGKPAEIDLGGPAEAVTGQVVVKFMGNRLQSAVTGTWDPATRTLVLDDVDDGDDAGRYTTTLSDDGATLSGQFSARHRVQVVPLKARHR